MRSNVAALIAACRVIDSIVLPALLERGAAIRRVIEAMEDLSLDVAWRVEIYRHRMKRTDAQNRYLWGAVYPAITERLQGWTKDDVHEYCLGEHFGWETISGLGARSQKPLRRSSKLSKVEFMDYIEFIAQRMAEHGIVIPAPDAEYGRDA